MIITTTKGVAAARIPGQAFQPERRRVKVSDGEPVASRGVEGTHLSPQAHQRLTEELQERSGPRRQQISDWIERARELGDLRENGDYHAAKNEQGLNEARVRQLEAILKHAMIVEQAATDRVVAGTVVEVQMEGDDEPSTYLIGSIEERGSAYDVISPGSPLGKALLGHSPGEVVIYEAPGGKFELEILSVRPPD